MKTIFFLFAIVAITSCSAPAKETLKFTKDNYAGEWPFAVSEMEVYCSGYKEIYGKAGNGKIYALNGSAKGASHSNPSISNVEEIWLDDPKFDGLKISYGDFITQGLTLCEDH